MESTAQMKTFSEEISELPDSWIHMGVANFQRHLEEDPVGTKIKCYRVAVEALDTLKEHEDANVRVPAKMLSMVLRRLYEDDWT